MSEEISLFRSFKISVYPNPFSKGLNILLDKPEGVNSGIFKIYDVKGALVKRFFGNRQGRIFWDKRDEKGRLVPSGLYFLFIEREEKGQESLITKVLLMH